MKIDLWNKTWITLLIIRSHRIHGVSPEGIISCFDWTSCIDRNVL